ncbi:MAG: 30S ribosomal protein S20 [Alphaproteobacteria bacterium]|nr:MAG: 30S ribosomal protein S20 [Alphaproteobacteria bacterium]
MANHKSTKKRLRRDTKVRADNKSKLRRLKTLVKGLKSYLHAKESNAEVAKSMLVNIQAYADKCGSKGIVHHGNSSRLIGRLHKQVNSVY